MSRIEPENCWFFSQHPGAKERILQVLDQWHEAHRADFTKSYGSVDVEAIVETNRRFDVHEEKHAHVGHKYVRLDTGGSGAWMLDTETGLIYQIKGYGKVDKKKIAGDIADPEFDGAVLFRDRFRHGRFDNRKPSLSWIDQKLRHQSED